MALKLYDQIEQAPDERARFRVIIDAIGQLEEAWPRPGEVARTTDVREAELRLKREIEGVLEETRNRCHEARQAELRLETALEQTKYDLLKWMMVPLTLAQILAIAALVKLL